MRGGVSQPAVINADRPIANGNRNLAQIDLTSVLFFLGSNRFQSSADVLTR